MERTKLTENSNGALTNGDTALGDEDDLVDTLNVSPKSKEVSKTSEVRALVCIISSFFCLKVEHHKYQYQKNKNTVALCYFMDHQCHTVTPIITICCRVRIFWIY